MPKGMVVDIYIYISFVGLFPTAKCSPLECSAAVLSFLAPSGLPLVLSLVCVCVCVCVCVRLPVCGAPGLARRSRIQVGEGRSVHVAEASGTSPDGPSPAEGGGVAIV